MMVEELFLAATSAAMYSLVYYGKSKSSNPEETFNKFKFAATITVGICIGVFYQFSGVDFSGADIKTKLSAYAGSIALVESMMKIAWRKYKRSLLGASQSN